MREIEAVSRLAVGPTGRPMVNMSGLPDELVADDDNMREIARRLSDWVNNARHASGRTSMFNRAAYTPPDNVYDEMAAAWHAVEHDDIVGGIGEVTESFAFAGGMKWESSDRDSEDVFNQNARDLNLDEFVRKAWQEVYATSSFVAATRWGFKTYKIRGENENGNQRKRKVKLWCPIEIRTLDVRRIVPLQTSPFSPGRLAWNATQSEVEHYKAAYRGDVVDPGVTQFFTGVYTPSQWEEYELSQLGIDSRNLLVLNPDLVFRFTLTKPDYERFPLVRLKSIFKLLDLKQQLIQSDRATLIGSANYLLLIRKGTDDRPAQPEEVKNLKDNYQFIAKMPVIIGDHRLSVDIIAPKTDFVLKADRYDTIDTRILTRLLGTLTFSSRGQRNETNVTLSKSVARSMQNRRHMMKRSLEERLARAVVEHPLNADADLHEPNLVFTPRNISLDIDPSTIQALMGLRSQREMSRETILEYFGLDQETEAQRMEHEEKFYGDVFPDYIPFAGQQPGQVTGPQGGRPAGGGNSPNNPTKPKAETDSGNPKTGD